MASARLHLPFLVLILLVACAGNTSDEITAGPVHELSTKMDRLLINRYSAYVNQPKIDGANVADHVEWVRVEATAFGDANSLAVDMIRLGAVDASVIGKLVSTRVPVGSLHAVSQLENLRFCRESVAATR